MKYRGLMMVTTTLVVISLALPTISLARWHGHGHRGWHGGWGWYGAGAFAGGVLLGTAISRPYYYAPPPVYVYPPPPVIYSAPPPPVYIPNQAYAYPDPAVTSRPENKPSASGPASSGQWVEVPGQSVNGKWVPPHKAWVPDNP
jgi:hypothetical protein